MNEEYEDLTVEELIELCDQRGLSKSGRKADLVARLELHDAEQDGTEGADAEAEAAAEAEGSDDADEGDEEPAVQGTDPPPSTGQDKTTGKPVQMLPENQDSKIKGMVVDERGNVLKPADEPDDDDDDEDGES